VQRGAVNGQKRVKRITNVCNKRVKGVKKGVEKVPKKGFTSAAAAVRCAVCAFAHTPTAHRANLEEQGRDFQPKMALLGAKLSLLGPKIALLRAQLHF
jgi:hypothetical protein